MQHSDRWLHSCKRKSMHTFFSPRMVTLLFSIGNITNELLPMEYDVLHQPLIFEKHGKINVFGVSIGQTLDGNINSTLLLRYRK